MLDLDAGLMSDLGVGLGLMPGLGIRLGHRRGFSVAGRQPVGGARSDIRISIKAFINTTNCYISDLEEGEKTLLLYEGEGKLSKIRSRLIYRDFPGVRPCTGRDSTLARKRIGLVL